MENRIRKKARLRLSKTTFLCGAVYIIFLASIGMNIRYAYTNYYFDIVTVIIFCALAVVFDVLKGNLLGQFFETLAKGPTHILNAFCKLIMWVFFVSASVYAAFATLSDVVINPTKQTAQVDRLEHELATVKSTQSVNQITAQMALERAKVKQRVLIKTKDCTYVISSKKQCAKMMALRVKLADAKRKQRLIEQKQVAEKSVLDLKPSHSAVVLAALLQRVGYIVSPQDIDLYRIIILLLGVEGAAAIGLTLVKIPRRKNTLRKHDVKAQSKINSPKEEKVQLPFKNYTDINDQTVFLLEKAIKKGRNLEVA